MAEQTEQNVAVIKFLAAVQDGATAYAHPDTIETVKGLFDFEFVPCTWMEVGILQAIDLSCYDLHSWEPPIREVDWGEH